MLKTEFIEMQILMIIDFMLHLTLAVGNRYVTIPSDLRIIRYVQLKDTNCNSKCTSIFRKKRHFIHGRIL